VIGMPHAVLKSFVPASGSIVVDPWRAFPPREGVRIVAVGRHSDG
jgi:hypothetical protein